MTTQTLASDRPSATAGLRAESTDSRVRLRGAEPSQHMRALARANELRIARANISHALRSGELRFADVDLEARELRTMNVLMLLQCLRWTLHPCGSTKRRSKSRRPLRVLSAAGVPPTFKVGQLTERQKACLKDVVGRMCVSQREDA